MTETVQAVIPLTEIPVSAREQAKADILESYLFSSLDHTAETLTATIHTTMKEGEEKLNAIALLQILQRFNLESVKISALVIHGVLAEEPFGESIFIPWDDEGLGRTVSLTSHGNDVTLTTSGTLPENGQNGELLSTFFDKGSGAGRILSDGRIDFRELHRYPSAKPGDLLIRVSLPLAEKNGLSHNGSTIQATPAKEYPLQLGKNVEKVYTPTDGGAPAYDIKSLREGVVITRMDQGNIVFIDVNDRIVVGNIDFSVGNIGSDVVCPVSMQAESVNEGFTVKVAGSITVRTIDGGNVESGKKAEVDQMLSGSTLIAGGDIACRSISSSTLTTRDGTAFIHREAIDSTINASRVEMNTSAGLLLNTQINACAIDLSNVRVSGINKVILAPGVFAKRDALLRDKQRLSTALREMEETLNKTKSVLVGELKSLSAEFGEDNSVRPVFKKIVESLKAYEFEVVPELMSSLKRGHTCLAVSGALRTIGLVKQQLERSWDLEARVKGVAEEIREVEEHLTAISFKIQARLRPSAMIEIRLGDKDMHPLVLAPPPQKDQAHAIRVKGKYTMDKGLVILEKSG